MTLKDKRESFFENDNHHLMSSLIYRTSTRGDHECPSFKFIWRNFAPPRVKFFGWRCRNAFIAERRSSASIS